MSHHEIRNEKENVISQTHSAKNVIRIFLVLGLIGVVLPVIRWGGGDRSIILEERLPPCALSGIEHHGNERKGASTPAQHIGSAPYGGEVIQTSDTPVIDTAPKERVRIVKTTLKYPIIRVVDDITHAGANGGEGQDTTVAMVADHILVRLRPGKTEADLAEFNAACGTTTRKRMLAPRTYVIQLPAHQLYSVPQAVNVYMRQRDLVEYAEPDYLVASASTVTPNDTNFDALWALHNTGQTGGLADADIDAPEAWSIGTGSRDIIVGVIDSGVDYNHPDLQANIWMNPGESGLDGNGNDRASNGIDDDENGFIDDVRGWDFMDHDAAPEDYWMHGTHVAGTLGAEGNNSSYVAGACWQVSLIPIKAVDFDANGGSGFISDVADATYYATDMGARLTCNSYGGAAYSRVMEDAIRDANENGVLFIASAGNESRDTDANWRYPSCYDLPNIICVGATDHNDELATFNYPWTPYDDADTNYGFETVDIFAPGTFIYSTYPTYLTSGMSRSGIPTNYGQLSGTSMSAPLVAGACALLMSEAPGLSHLQIKDVILGTADPKEVLSGKSVTGARLNLNSVLLASQQAAVSIGSKLVDDDNAGSSIGNGDGLVNPGETIELHIRLRNVGAEYANSVTASLALMSPDPHVTVLTNSASFGNLAAGEDSEQEGSYLIQFSEDAPTPHLSKFLLTITDSSGKSWAQAVAINTYESSSISGTVRSFYGVPKEGVEVVVTGLGRLTALTDSHGQYAITLPAGIRYHVEAVKAPYISYGHDLSLNSTLTNLDFTLYRFRSVDLGTLGGDWAYATGINDAGQIVGASMDSEGDWHGFLWENNNMQALDELLPPNRPFLINNQRKIVAGNYLYEEGSVSAFAQASGQLYATAMNDLGMIAGRRIPGEAFNYEDGSLSDALLDSPADINSRGQAVGHLSGTGAAMVQNGQVTPLPAVPEYPHYSIANAINNAEVAAGIVSQWGKNMAVVWSNGVPQLLSAEVYTSTAVAINEQGLVGGHFWEAAFGYDQSVKPSANDHACFWGDGRIVDIHGLGANTEKSWASAVNNAGVILGNWSDLGYGAASAESPGYESLAYAIVPVVTCVDKGATWRVHASDTAPASDWYTPSYDDGSWSEGRGILGYGESYVHTALPFGADPQDRYVTTYFRKSFNVATDPSGISELALSACYDDGMVVYLNGHVVETRSISVEPEHGDLAQSHESNDAISPLTPVYERIDLAAHTDKLLQGTNLIAVQLHQASADSEDLIWDAEMTYEIWQQPESSEAFVLDYDDDGLADEFEWHIINYNLSDTTETLVNVLPNGDFDGDGARNAFEEIAGTDATSAEDYLRIKSIDESSPAFRVLVDGKIGRTYHLERSTTLSPPWTEVEQVGPLTEEQEVAPTDSAPPADAAFYRIRVTR